MQIHALTTGTVTVTTRWQSGKGGYAGRLMRALADPRHTEPLPIWCFVIPHPDGLIVVDSGIPHNANQPVYFPPHMRLVQRAARFQIAGPQDEIGPQMRALGFDRADVRQVVLTHLHQDHDGGLHHFPNAQVLVSRTEWQAAQGLSGSMAGYLRQHWPTGFRPHTIDFAEHDPIFGGRATLTRDGSVYVVPTPGHTPGHLSVIVQQGDHALFIAGDTSYTQAAVLADQLDGVSRSGQLAHQTHARIRAFARQQPTVYMPTHEWASRDRLAAREPLPAGV